MSSPTTSTIVQEVPTKETVSENQIEKWWENWYEENNINLLLYIGAFLIVSSAAIFVGFNWETFTGVFKAFVLSLLTGGFFLAGFFFYFQTPKLKNAGSTFLAIASLLIPFNGLAWYNFALHDGPVSFGVVWLLTSIIAAFTYFSLSLLIKNRFYTYIAGLGTLSLIEALVNVSSLNTRFYVLGGIFSAFTLLLGSKIISDSKKEGFDELYSEPLNISSQITMPIFLVWGLLIASSTEQLFTIEATLSALLAFFFYLLTFSIKRNFTYLVLSELLFALSLVLGIKTAGFQGVIIYILVLFFGLILQLIAFYFNKINKQEEGYYTVFTASFVSLLELPFAFIDQLVTKAETVYLILIVSFLNALSAFIQRQPTYLYLTIGGIDLAGFVYVSNVMERTDLFNPLGLGYFAFSLLLLFIPLLAKNVREDWNEVLLHGAYFNLGLAVLFNLNSAQNLILISLFTFVVAAFLKYKRLEDDPLFSTPVAVGLGVLGLFASFFLPEYSTNTQIYFSAILGITAFLATYLEKKPGYLYIALAAIDLVAFLQITKAGWLKETNQILSLTYLLLGLMQYFAGVYFWEKLKNWALNFLIFSALNLAFAFGFALPSESWSLVVSIVISLVAFSSLYFLKKEELGYLGSVFACISIVNIFRFFNLDSDFYPIGFIILGYLFYLISTLGISELFDRVLKYSGLIISFSAPVIFGLYAQNNSAYTYYDGYQYRTFGQENNLELFSLISAYLATILFATEAYRSKSIQLGYFTSVAGLLTVLWQYKFLDFSEVQIYSITTAVYLLIISYTRERLGKSEDRQLFDYSGLAILFFPAFVQALPETGFWYAVLLGFEGLILLFCGLSTKYKIYTYAGVAALVIATLTRVYSFIASLGSWAIIGSLGLAFLATAIYLLSKRKID